MEQTSRLAAVHREEPSGYPPLLSDREFKQFSSLIYETCGIKLPPIKKTMLSARLHKRLRTLSIGSFKEYLEFVLSAAGREREFIHMLDAVSTNKTDFFREPDHFDFMSQHLLPGLVAGGLRHRLRVWSAGCSSGEEVYTLAMVLAEFGARQPGFDFAVLGTDLCTRVLATAEQGIYPDERVAAIPKWLLHRYFMRGKGVRRNTHRVVPELRQKVMFQRLNFKEEFGLEQPMDIIFCRNVIIYFDRPTQTELFSKFYRQLAPGGYLFIGHSETLEGITDKLHRIAPTVYQK